ncbi:MAG: TIGR01777 family oxidoreductase [Flavobacteriaceae bacterium]
MNKIIIAGGTGYLGNILSSYFIKESYNVTIITRGNSKTENKINYINWDDNWQSALESSKAIINLTGKSINCLFTANNKKAIIESRLTATKKINLAILQCNNPPEVFINASGASIYKCSFDKTHDEYNEDFGNSFLTEVCKQWETEFYKKTTPNTRKVAIRITPVLGKESHAIKPLKKVVALGLGGKQGHGKQYFSWIHETDFIKAIQFIIDTKKICGTVNLTSPNAITNHFFMQSFRKAMRIPFGIPTPSLLLHLSKYVTKVEPELILDSIRIYPKKLEEFDFEFDYGTIEKALEEIVKK